MWPKCPTLAMGGKEEPSVPEKRSEGPCQACNMVLCWPQGHDTSELIQVPRKWWPLPSHLNGLADHTGAGTTLGSEPLLLPETMRACPLISRPFCSFQQWQLSPGVLGLSCCVTLDTTPTLHSLFPRPH
jgi:hypothetical protein